MLSVSKNFGKEWKKRVPGNTTLKNCIYIRPLLQ